MKINNCCFSRRGYNKACWLIENECNLNCQFCFHNQFRTDKQLHDIRNADYSKTIASLKEKKIEQIIISGGEPLLSSKLFEIIDLLEKSGFTISICTNAILATPSFCERLKQTAVRKLTVNMASICNANGKIVDGPNFTRVTNGIRNLTSFGFSVTLNNILHTSTSSENILQNIEYGCRLGVAGFSFTVPVCKSSCEEYESDYYISEPVVQQLIVMVKEIEHKMSPKLNIEFNYPDCNADSCPANSEIFGITSDGVVSTCLIKQYQMNC